MIKNLSKGITLVEVVVSIAIIIIFTIILIADFPAILRQFAISRATYKLAQDLRRAQDLGLSGAQVKDANGDLVVGKGGYGIYIDASSGNNKQYILYADTNLPLDYQYDQGQDSIVETIDISREEPGVSISRIDNLTGGNAVSINFTPPNPTTTISNLNTQGGETGINIVLVSDADSSITRTVSVNKSGLIEVK